MKPEDFKGTWQKIRINPDADMPEEWKKFKGKVKISDEDKDRLIFDKEYLAHSGAGINSKMAQSMMLDKEDPKIKKLFVTVCQDLDEPGLSYILNKNRKKAELVGKESNGQYYIFEWKAPVEVLQEWNSDIHEDETLEGFAGWDMFEEHKDELEVLAKEEFFESTLAKKLSIVGLRGLTETNHEYFVMKLMSSDDDPEQIKEVLESYVEEEGLEISSTFFPKPFVWTNPDLETLWSIFRHQHMAVQDTDEMNSIENYDNIINVLKEQFVKSFGKVRDMNIDSLEASEPNADISRRDKMFNQGKALGGAIVQGAAMAAADQGGELLLDLAQKYAPKMPIVQTLLESPEGREFLKMFFAMTIHTVAYQTDLLPKKELLLKAAEQQMTLSSYKIIGPQLAVLRKFALSFAETGEKLAELEELTGETLKVGEQILVEVEDVGNDNYRSR